ncbi:DUF3515 family protein [Psychromicrobium xiongbiense]|uniref:DUF3515 family protein n=1 Tax=Psychromicrobium xiongbiense TaxID=3051184 RepID=UPI002555E210|nr:DUF3515 family protein [Psychromicrobium sp. YIM S02556]
MFLSPRWSRSVILMIGALSVTGTLAACAPAVDVAPAPASANAACAPEMIALPDSLGGFPLRETASQGTAAWGDPTAVVLRCGVASPPPTTSDCATVNGIDWVITPSKQDPHIFTLTTYGRTPATEIVLDDRVVASSTVLPQLAGAAAKIPQGDHRCLGVPDLATASPTG